jgi:hypothetical protein
LQKLTKEEAKHPDVRAVFPGLVNARWKRGAEPAVYESTEVLEIWFSLYERDKDLFPITTINIPDRTGEDAVTWWTKRKIEEASTNPRAARWWHTPYRSGQETTIHLLARESPLEERVATFLVATLGEIGLEPFLGVPGIRPNTPLIPTAIVCRLLSTLGSSLGSVGSHYHPNVSAYAPWRAGITWYRHDKLKNVRSLRELLALCCEVARAAQEEGGLVRIRSAPNAQLALRMREEGGALLESALSAYRNGDFSAACSAAARAAHALGESLDLERIVNRDPAAKE